MPMCSYVKCGARKNKNQPQLVLHRFPRNETLKQKWLDAVGEKNMNHRHKDWHLCSLHFKESCYNRTLNVMRLHENSVPTVFLTAEKKQHKESTVLSKTSNIKNDDTSTVMLPLQLPHRTEEIVHKEVIPAGKIKVLKEIFIKQQQKIKRLNERLRKKNKQIVNMKDIIKDLQRKNIKLKSRMYFITNKR